MRDAVNEAELQAILAISKARDAGYIKKRNILKMDIKVNEFLIKFLTTTSSGKKFEITLPEKIKN